MDPHRAQPTPNSLLNLAIAAQTASSTPNGNSTYDSDTTGHDQFDRTWLEEAMAASFGGASHDPVKRMISLIEELKNCDIDPDQALSDLGELLEITEHIYFANDFEKCGGFPVLQSLLSSSSSDVRAKAAELFAQLMQNNPYCQAKVIEHVELFRRLLDMLENDEDPHVRAQALLGISALIRSNQEAQTKFVDLDGLSVLLRSMTDISSERFQNRAAFMLSCVCDRNQSLAEQLGEMGLAQYFISLLQGDHKQYHEHLMQALAAILNNSEAAKRDATRDEVDLEGFLKNRLKNIQDEEQYQEEREAAQRILNILDNYHSENGDDR